MEKPMNRLCDSCLVPLCFLPLSLIIYLFPASDEERVDQFFLKPALLLDHTAFFFFLSCKIQVKKKGGHMTYLQVSAVGEWTSCLKCHVWERVTSSPWCVFPASLPETAVSSKPEQDPWHVCDSTLSTWHDISQLIDVRFVKPELLHLHL